DEATVNRGFGNGRLFAGQDGIERQFQVVARQSGACTAQPLLVVDSSTVAQAPTGIENDDFGCALDTEGLRARAIGVLDEGKLDPKINRLLRQLRNAVVERDIHRKELHCLAAIRLIELLELRPIALRDRACGIGEDENVSLLVPEVFQRARQVADVLEMQLR